ncbi:formyl peptide receptor-like 1 inhibitory protein [Staphylococcus argenteus]|uniref:formyl peptide receptor-like 1 inhibitory protein n=1 Tax=Staphylococcus argenteus TaxID=985002 RepID=UPI000918FFE0|nr:formyl peptide receptor-like 1 inhibitory protein [Staphylococcus argenteus]MCG9853472.1 formyl peptide receptor-like 1 inhibitory protein [Staphylococcus argenteus]MDR7648947.1 formyl peptide receptor-like 1 inhibitory protein [Staphylococcus argenteus]MDR7681649.1 formyl peptide receptor-like 1 inhibitory protein [Staphylococcus argenteus]SGW49815.1 FPRL1 inhibitory protein [Staphylococcus argenteus]SGX24185.1 FPRL1 inhibitory protein [Staphylococcus argenteus]
MKKNITKTLIASTVIAVGILTTSNDAKAFFSYEWQGLEIVKKLADDEKKDQERADKLINEADKNNKPYTGKTVEDLYVIAKKLGKGNKTAVVYVNNGKDFYTFDITRPLEEHRKNIKVVGSGEISSIDWQ